MIYVNINLLTVVIFFIGCFFYLFDCKRIAIFLLVAAPQMRKMQLAYNQKPIKKLYVSFMGNFGKILECRRYLLG